MSPICSLTTARSGAPRTRTRLCPQGQLHGRAGGETPPQAAFVRRLALVWGSPTVSVLPGAPPSPAPALPAGVRVAAGSALAPPAGTVHMERRAPPVGMKGPTPSEASRPGGTWGSPDQILRAPRLSVAPMEPSGLPRQSPRGPQTLSSLPLQKPPSGGFEQTPPINAKRVLMTKSKELPA